MSERIERVGGFQNNWIIDFCVFLIGFAVLCVLGTFFVFRYLLVTVCYSFPRLLCRVAKGSWIRRTSTALEIHLLEELRHASDVYDFFYVARETFFSSEEKEAKMLATLRELIYRCKGIGIPRWKINSFLWGGKTPR